MQQHNIKRLMAYSSIGQVGYMLMGIAAIGYGDAEVGRNASTALLLHITGYVDSTLAVFAALMAYYNRTGQGSIEGLRGLAETQPFLALVITVSLFSFAGMPFFAGFTTKLFMFQASTTDELLWLVGAGRAEQLHQPLLLPDGHAPDVPVRPDPRARALPRTSGALGRGRRADADRDLHRHLPRASVRSGGPRDAAALPGGCDDAGAGALKRRPHVRQEGRLAHPVALRWRGSDHMI